MTSTEINNLCVNDKIFTKNKIINFSYNLDDLCLIKNIYYRGNFIDYIYIKNTNTNIYKIINMGDLLYNFNKTSINYDRKMKIKKILHIIGR